MKNFLRLLCKVWKAYRLMVTTPLTEEERREMSIL